MFLFRPRQRDRLSNVPERDKVAVMARHDMARLAGRDHEARLLEVREILGAAKARAFGRAKGFSAAVSKPPLQLTRRASQG
jgi:hypothetical protein